MCFTNFYNRRDDDDNTKYGNAIIKLSRFAFVLSLSQCLESADVEEGKLKENCTEFLIWNFALVLLSK